MTASQTRPFASLEILAYDKKFNCERAAKSKRALGPDAKVGVDFEIVKADGLYYWRALEVAKVGAAAVEEAGRSARLAKIVQLRKAHPERPAVVASMAAQHRPGVPSETSNDRIGRVMFGDDLPRRGAAVAALEPAPAAPKPARSGSKIAAALDLARRPEGVSMDEVRELTGWTKLGGFFTAAKRAGISFRKDKVDGKTRFYA